ncbi:ferritin-like domain-containing protein [Streptomyces purpureus]|uniref:ferritin-like domain-containing protein n=1 Tax=Streptomyces purpureus TaxID=1951 RepID=UPI000381958F|nr:ferritin-like protein [Streptomyces purpureus]
MTSLLEYRSNRIVELMEEPAERRDADWLKESLQQAMMLELATLPPYLSAMWSIEPQSGDVFQAIRRIVFDEMSHLGLAGNMLTTIGGVPRLGDVHTVPKYPGQLPGGVRPSLKVFLSGLTKESLELFAKIEEPDDPIAEARSHTSIGAFYTAILEAFQNHPELITGAHQLERRMEHHGAGNSLAPLTSLADVEAAVDVIKEQGEGTSASPENPHAGQSPELAHFYVFRELFHGRKLVKVAENPDRWEFTGDPIAMPGTRPMGTVPEGGWGAPGHPAPDAETQTLLDKVNQKYSQMLDLLERAWKAEDTTTAEGFLDDAVGEMVGLKGPARLLMLREVPGGGGKTYGPEFRYVET